MFFQVISEQKDPKHTKMMEYILTLIKSGFSANGLCQNWGGIILVDIRHYFT